MPSRTCGKGYFAARLVLVSMLAGVAAISLDKGPQNRPFETEPEPHLDTAMRSFIRRSRKESGRRTRRTLVES